MLNIYGLLDAMQKKYCNANRDTLDHQPTKN